MALMTRKERKEEVRRILALDTDELIKQSNGQLKVFDTLDEVYEFLAEEMVQEFEKAAKGDKIVSFIMPVGPTQPYRIMAEKINYRNISLKNVRFFFMDEYVDDEKGIYPEYLIKAMIAGNLDSMEQLGAYEVAPEDFALCEYVCTSKMPLQAIVRAALDNLKKEIE